MYVHFPTREEENRWEGERKGWKEEERGLRNIYQALQQGLSCLLLKPQSCAGEEELSVLFSK
jgi:hypothetical protein